MDWKGTGRRALDGAARGFASGGGRGYGQNYRGGSALYEAEAEPPAWLTGLENAVGGFLTVRDMKRQEQAAQEAADREAGDRSRKVNADINIGLAQTEAVMREQEDNRAKEAQAAAQAAQAAREKRERDAVARQLLERYALTGGPREAALLASIGTPASTLEAVRPKPAAGSKEDEAYQSTKGRLRAQQEMGAGDFKPKPAAGPAGVNKTTGNPFTPTQLRSKAIGAARAAAGQVLDAYPNATATTVIRAIMDDPAYADINGDPSWGRELQSQAEQILQAERAKRMPKGGRGGLGAAAAAFRAKK